MVASLIASGHARGTNRVDVVADVVVALLQLLRHTDENRLQGTWTDDAKDDVAILIGSAPGL